MQAISSIASKGIVGSEVATKYLVSMRIPSFHCNLYFVISNLFGVLSGHRAMSKEMRLSNRTSKPVSPSSPTKPQAQTELPSSPAVELTADSHRNAKPK
jgi:hypothetical protein